MKLFNYKNQNIYLLYLVQVGSKLFGTNYEKGEHPFDPNYVSDNDYKGVFISEELYLSIFNKTESVIPAKSEKVEITNKNKKEFLSLMKDYSILPNANIEEDDIELFSLEKFLFLISKSNPNVIDILFAPKENIIYESKIWSEVTNSKNKTLTQEIRNTFSEYANAQLGKIKGHKKWLSKYPEINEVLKLLESCYKKGIINKEFLNNYFSSDLTNRFSEKYGIINKDNFYISFEDFVDNYVTVKKMKKYINKYRKPVLYDYCSFKGLDNHSYKKDSSVLFSSEIQTVKIIEDETELEKLKEQQLYKLVSIKEFIYEYSAFRKISNTFCNIFLKPNLVYEKTKIFVKNGSLNTNDSEFVGKYAFSMSLDTTNYVKDTKNIEKLWLWRCERNEKRAILEEKFGYDVKHASHLYRLLVKAKYILQNREYNPKLSGEDLIMCKDILKGKYTYGEIINISEIELNNVKIMESNLDKEINKDLINLWFKQISSYFL